VVLNLLRRHPIAASVCLSAGLVDVVRRVDSRIDPIEWPPPDPPETTGALAPSRELAGADTVVSWEGPEDVAFDAGGRLYTGIDQNHVVRTVEPVEADTTYADLERVAADDGTHWLAIPTPRDETLDGLHARPRMKRKFGKRPTSAMQQVEGDEYGLVLKPDADGEIVDSLQAPDGIGFGVTSATPPDGALSSGRCSATASSAPTSSDPT